MITCVNYYELNSSLKSIIGHNTLHLELKDEGDLEWPSRTVANIAGVIIKKMNCFYENQN